MNIHPVFVHFPIALMTFYAICELLRFKKLTNTTYWFYVKAVLVIAGTLSAFLALNTGELAEHLADRGLRPLIETHSAFASASTWIFGIISLLYLISWISRSELNQKILNSKIGSIWNKKVYWANKIINSWFIILLAFVGLCMITITGALGGAIVYGPNVDPIVSFIYHLFF